MKYRNDNFVQNLETKLKNLSLTISASVVNGDCVLSGRHFESMTEQI